MLELGASAAQEHRRLGAAVAAAPPELLVAVGAFAGETAAGALEAGLAGSVIETAADADGAAGILRAWLRPGDLVLLKASRGVRLERVLERLVASGAIREAGPDAAAAERAS